MAAKKKVLIRLPRPAAGEDPDRFVAVNGKAYRIQKGVEVEVDEAVAEVLRNAEDAEILVDKFLDENKQQSPK